MLQLKIVSPERIEYDGAVESIQVPGTLGQFEILTNHAPMISSLGVGEVVYTAADGKHTIEIAGGFVEVQKNKVSLCVELQEHD